MGKPVDPMCHSFQAAIEVLSRPWTGLLLGLLHDGPLRFSELEARSCGVGAKTLSARLKDLEARGIVARRVEPGPPVRVHYMLTPKGRAFSEVAEAIERWGRELTAGDSREPRAASMRRRPRRRRGRARLT